MDTLLEKKNVHLILKTVVHSGVDQFHSHLLIHSCHSQTISSQVHHTQMVQAVAITLSATNYPFQRNYVIFEMVLHNFWLWTNV